MGFQCVFEVDADHGLPVDCHLGVYDRVDAQGIGKHVALTFRTGNPNDALTLLVLDDNFADFLFLWKVRPFFSLIPNVMNPGSCVVVPCGVAFALWAQVKKEGSSSLNDLSASDKFTVVVAELCVQNPT